ncbi:NAD(P)-dependent oxidoreductase [Sinomicrobium weinanense]|uniref:NAD(P)-dependent oxidoreductase n=1 Tax=Sinomicrobium weinanense TaxID=2842200 RepID=A0A926JR76_9FLAO|nr:NAD(P)-binding domain-containing protein [Sinomicrobium weinanense]MBC9795958.1 NAD(P)-dependent oxidoreductase [Sinomicrobium weinanense]MBU3122077.1 NAD(P)-binding domain-containing protein [Sinomicrobium weinanense]
MNTSNKIQARVSVIGLGNMGYKLAELLLQKGYEVTVWNRSAHKAGALVAEGAVLAETVAEAIAASPVTVICVYDYNATKAILRHDDVAAAVHGKTLIELTTGSPEQADEAESWARRNKATYLDGAIQAAPEQMGRKDTPIFISGNEEVFRKHGDLLQVFGGGVSYLGSHAGAASAMDLATLSYLYGSIIGFFHGARIVESEGMDVGVYGKLTADITPTFGEFLEHEGKVIRSGNFEISQSPLRISVEAVERILKQAKGSGINTELPELASGLLQKAKAAGYENEELAALIKVMRKSA